MQAVVGDPELETQLLNGQDAALRRILQRDFVGT